MFDWLRKLFKRRAEAEPQPALFDMEADLDELWYVDEGGGISLRPKRRRERE